FQAEVGIRDSSVTGVQTCALPILCRARSNGGTSWFFITADYLFGHSIERDTGDVVRAAGGTVVGSARHPLNNQDFSSFLLQAQRSEERRVGKGERYRS